MRLVEIDWNPPPRKLRQFAALAALALPFSAWMCGATTAGIAGLGAAGVVLTLVGLAWPGVAKPVFVAASMLTAPLGMLLGELAILLIFFGVFLPIALAFRLLGRDGLERRLDRDATSYWQEKKQPQGAASYFHQS